MNKRELEALNTELIDFLIGVREQIDEKLDELAAVEEDEDGEQEADGDELSDEDDED